MDQLRDMEIFVELDEKKLLECCGSSQFAKEMALASPFSSLDQAISAGRHIWFDKVKSLSYNHIFVSLF